MKGLALVFATITICASILAALASGAAASDNRNPATVRAFRKTHPCPATGQVDGPCPGWVVDHGLPLCALGAVADDVRNMHWQMAEDAKWKDSLERQLCAKLRACSQ